MNYPITRIFLAISGMIAAVIGALILFTPHTFFAMNDIALGNDPNLLSEIRAPGGLLIAAGLVMNSGVVMRNVIQLGLLTGLIVFGMYGISRVVSLLLDGIPSASLLSALGIELLIGIIAALLIGRFALTKPNR